MARYLRRWVGGALALGLAGGDPAAAQQGTPVDLELVLAIDTSGSVDPWEFNLQLRGIAAAFRDPEVQAAIEGSTPGGSRSRWCSGRAHRSSWRPPAGRS